MSRHSHVSQHAIKDRRCMRFFLAMLALLCFTLGLAACSGAADPVVTDAPKDDAERPPFTVAAGAASETILSSVTSLSLTTTKKEYSAQDTKITYSLVNKTDTAIWLYDLEIEIMQDGEWHRLADRTDIIVVDDMIGHGVRPHGTAEFTASFYEYGDIVPAGTYRLVLGVSTDEEPSVTEYLAAEFAVIEWPSQTPSPDQPELAKDFRKIETEYFDHQELLQSIVQAFWDNEEILDVAPASAPEGAKLRTADGEAEAFARDYPRLYSDVCSLSEAGFKWLSFSRNEEQENVIACHISHDIYQKGYWTSFSFYFCADTLPEIPQTDYYAQLAENCWLIARKLPTA